MLAPMERRSVFFFALLLSVLFPAFLQAEHEGKIQILLLGDSTTEGSIPRKLNPEGPHLETVIEMLLAAEGVEKPCQVHNLGLSGEYIQRLLESGRYERAASKLPGIDWIFIRYGLNDRAKREDFPVNFPKDFKELIRRLRQDHPGATIVPMTVIPYLNEEDSEKVNQLVRQVAEEEGLELFDIYPRYAAELEKGFHMLNYRRFPLEKVPENLRPLVERRVMGDRVVVMDNEFDGILGHLPGWFSDRHPNLAGYNVIGDETAKWLAAKLRSK